MTVREARKLMGTLLDAQNYLTIAYQHSDAEVRGYIEETQDGIRLAICTVSA